MDVTLSNISAVRCLTVLALILFLSACVESESPSAIIQANADGSSTMGLSMPPAIYASRMVNRNNLRAVVTLDGNLVNMQRNGEQWTGSFTLPGSGTYPLSIRWVEVFENQDLDLAAAPVMQISPDSSRNIVVSNYNDQIFDADGDGVSNLDERNAGTPPRSTSNGNNNQQQLPNDNQLDCRINDGITAPSFNVIEAAQGNFDIPPRVSGTDLIYLESYWIRVPGTLSIEHRSGGPANTATAAIFDTDLSNSPRFIDLQVQIAGNRTTVEARLLPGIYCYILISSDQVPDNPAPATIFNRFVPD